jgi:hypothetical protein
MCASSALQTLPQLGEGVGLGGERLRVAVEGVMGSLMPGQLTAKGPGGKPVWEVVLEEYKEALDAEVRSMRDKLERTKREVMDPLAAVVGGRKEGGEEDDDEDDEDGDGDEEGVVVVLGDRKVFDSKMAQAELQRLVQDQADIAMGITEQVGA